jgi:RimJ/RimL family protein N-acetyltransferase
MRHAPTATSFQLTTSRLRLRVVQPADTDFLYTLYADRQITQYLVRTPSPFTYAHAQAWIEEAQVGFAQRHTYMLIIDELQTSHSVGMITLRIPSLDPAYPEEWREDDRGLGILGYSILPSAWGRRYATESAQEMVTFAFEELGLQRLQASPLQTNTASRRVLERVGFTIAEADIWEEPLHGGPPQRADCYLLLRNIYQA